MNYLAQLRRQFTQQLGIQREAFAESGRVVAGYELEDDEPDFFEEEIAADLAAKKKRADAKKASDKKALAEPPTPPKTETPKAAPEASAEGN